MVAVGQGAVDKVSKTGDTMTGDLVLPGTPATQAGAAPKSYIDGAFVGAMVESGGSYAARPSTVGVVLWVGSVPPPSSAPASDVWFNTSGGGGAGGGGITGTSTITDSGGNVWVGVVTGTTAGGYQATVVWLPAMQDEAFGVITDEAGGVLV